MKFSVVFKFGLVLWGFLLLFVVVVLDEINISKYGVLIRVLVEVFFFIVKKILIIWFFDIGGVVCYLFCIFYFENYFLY